MLYAFVLPAVTDAGPEIAVGCPGVATGATVKDLGDDDAPQALFAVTCIVVPVVPGVAVMLVVVELPDQPPGKVHV